MPKTLSISPANKLLLCVMAMAVSLAACSDDEERRDIRPKRPLGAIVAETAEGTLHSATHVVQEPFEDIGLKREEIPAELERLRANPYIMPTAPLCENLSYEVRKLNTLLGADMGPGAKGDKPSYTEEGLEAAQDKTIDMMRGEVQIIPFRGVVRRISGAEKHARKVLSAYEAGKLRRAYLKGLQQAYGCE